MDETKIEAALTAILERLDVLEQKVDAIPLPPRALKYSEAAQLLSCSPTVIKEMVAKRKLRMTVEQVGSRPRIPISEIVRITAVADEPKRSPHAALDRHARNASRSAGDEARAIRALGKKLTR